jgi:signal transduction histidine kinase
VEALRQPLATDLPAEFMARFDSVRDDWAPAGHAHLYKFRLALPTGETRVANIAIAPLLTRDFDVVGRIILVDDITDRIELEAQLTQAEKLSSIGLLAAGVAHEVNTPLAVISSYTQMLAKQMRPMMEQDPSSSAGARKDHAADLPRIRDRQRPAQLLAHRRHRVCLGRPEPLCCTTRCPARAPVQDRQHPQSRPTSTPPCRASRATRASCSRWC